MAAIPESLAIGLSRRATAGSGALQVAVRLWFLVTLIGQSLFVLHIVSFYGRTTLAGDFAAWNKILYVGYVSGDAMGNGVLGLHLAMAAMITFAGLLQLIPQIRQRIPTFHRWVGRVYIPAAFLAGASAFYLVLIRGGVIGDTTQHVTVLLNGLLIMICAAMALRYALARDFTVHRRWALRLFLVVSGVWFFRVGLFFWVLVNHGPVGFDDRKFEGPFLTFLSFAQFLLPLAVLELYLLAQRRASPVGRYAVAAALIVLTVVMAIGIFAYTMFTVKSGTAV